jgi:hypothetical protein
MPVDELPNQEAAHPEWFRPPTRREHAIGAALFVGFGVFFALLFVVLAGWWFRWVILGLSVYSTVRGLRHLLGVIDPRPRG